jgi:dipeptidyl aminopeptidase/acylaminoacyl peptidase
MNDQRADAWASRFTVERILDFRVAKADRDRGAVALLAKDLVGLGTWRAGDERWRTTDIATDDLQASAWLAADGRALYRLEDESGNELGHVQRVSLDGDRDGDDSKPVDLTPDWAPYTLRGGDSSRDGRLVAFTPIDAEGFRLAVAPADGSGPTRTLYQSPAEAWEARLSADGAYASVDTTDHNPGVRRWAVSVFDTATGERIGCLVDPDGGSVSAACFAPATGDPRLLVGASRGATGLTRPEIWNPVTGELHVLDVAGFGAAADDASAPVEVYPFDWSDDGRRVLLGAQRYAEQWLAVHDLETGATTPVDVPRGGYWSPAHRPSFGRDGSVLVPQETMADPMTVWRWRPGAPAERVLSSGSVPAGHPARSVTFPSADGTTIQAWLITPDGPGPHPAMVSVHGGPHWYASDMFNPEAQAWADEGFAFLDVNFRGSTGRGRAFAEQIWGDIGRYELEDMAAAHRWLVESGVARAGAVFLTGASYGGYLTLYGLSRQPELWAGGFALVAGADWAHEYRDASAALQGAIRGWFGGSPDELPELYAERSPITYAADLRAPLVIVNALNDSRVPPEQMRNYLSILESLGKDVTVRWIDGGHSLPPGEEWRVDMELFVSTARRVLDAAGAA